MADFVNYNKREVTLPGGFKDLTDLFDPPQPDPIAEFQKETRHLYGKSSASEIVPHESGSISVHEIGPKVRAVYEAKASLSSLSLDAPGPHTFHLSLLHMRIAPVKGVEPVEALHGHLTIGRAPKERADAVMRVFASYGLEPRITENFSLCKPEAAPEIGFDIKQIPEDPEAFVKLAVALFHELVSKSDEPLLRFTHQELHTKE